MSEDSRKKYPSLPPDYATIDMLRERWLKKQEEKKLKEEQEQEALEETQNLEKDCKNQQHREPGDLHRSENNGMGERVGNDGGEMTVIEEKGEGKEKMGWSGNGRLTNKYYRSKNEKHGADRKGGNGDISKVKMEVTEKRRNPRIKQELNLVEEKNGPKGVEIIPRNKEKVGISGFPSGKSSGTQGIRKMMSGGMTGVLPLREGSSQISMAQDLRRDGFRGGFRRNKNDRDEGFRGKEHRVEPKELKDDNSLGKKMEDEFLQIDWKGNGRKRRSRRRKGDTFKQSGAEASGLKANKVELKPANEGSEIGNERDHMKGLDSGIGRNDIKQNGVDGEALAADSLVLQNKVEDIVSAEKSGNGGFRGDGDRRGNLGEKFENLAIDDNKGRYTGSEVERKFRGNSRHVNYGRLEVDRRIKQRNRSMVWVKKEQSGAFGGEVSSMGVPPDE